MKSFKANESNPAKRTYISCLEKAWEDDILTPDERTFLNNYGKLLKIPRKQLLQIERGLLIELINCALKYNQNRIGKNYSNAALKIFPEDPEFLKLKDLLCDNEVYSNSISFEDAILDFWDMWTKDDDPHKAMYKELLHTIWEDFKVTTDERSLIQISKDEILNNPDIQITANELLKIEIDTIFKLIGIAEIHGKKLITLKLLKAILELDQNNLTALAIIDEIKKSKSTLIQASGEAFRCAMCGVVMRSVSEAGDYYCTECGSHSNIFPYEESVTLSMLSNKKISDRYTLKDVLDRGGTAIIYLAEDNEENDLCVIKAPLPDHDTKMEERRNELIRKEGEILKSLSSPHIVKFRDITSHLGKYRLILDYINGYQMRQRCKNSGTNLYYFSRWGTQIMDTLDYIHGKDILHRDLNPNNLIVNLDDDVVFIDFGTAKNIVNASNISTRLGTNIYAAPEQSFGLEIGPESDIYSLGGTLYFLTTGYNPKKMKNGKLPKINRYSNFNLNDRIYDFIAKCMENDRSDRYQSVGEMKRDFIKLTEKIPMPSTDQVEEVKSLLMEELNLSNVFFISYEYLDGQLKMKFNLPKVMRNRYIEVCYGSADDIKVDFQDFCK